MRKTLLLMLTAIVFTVAFLTAGAGADNAGAGSEAKVKPEVKVEAKEIAKDEKNCSIKITYPYFSGFSSAEKLNDIVRNKNIDSIGYINNISAGLKELKDSLNEAGEPAPSAVASLNSYFDYNFSGDILSFEINTYEYSGGAHGISYVESYTVNTKTGEIYTFDSLFNQNSKYKELIPDKINALIDKEKDLYFEEAKQTVKDKNGDFKFYMDGNKLVIYFDLYELRPYAGGMPFFELDYTELKGLLKDDIYLQMFNAEALEQTRFNGTSRETQLKIHEEPIYGMLGDKKVIQYYTYMVPLRSIAEDLGYEVTWDPQKGAGVAGGYLKNNVNSYYTANSEKTQLDMPPQIIGGRTYVPVEYFSQVLKENVFYYDDILRIFKASGEAGRFEEQIVNFVLPGSAEECVNMYAQAASQRQGAIQYALMSEELRAELKAGFEDMNWVTGVSSPWITGYDVYEQKTESKKTYNIIFHWATSAGKVPDSKTIVTVENAQQQEAWQITSLTE